MKLNFTLTIYLLFILSTFQLHAADGFLSNLSITPYVKTKTNIQIKCNVLNKNDVGLTSFKISWQLNNGTVNTSNQINISNGGITTKNYLPYTHSASLNVPTEGAQKIKIWIDGNGETNRSNDTISFNFTGLNTYVDKAVLFEEGTGTWCQYCPDANKALSLLASDPKLNIVQFHINDSYTITEAQDYFYKYFPPNTGFFPAGVLEMGVNGNYAINSNHPLWADDIKSSQLGVSPVELSTTANYNSSTKKLTIKLEANFKYSEAGDYRFMAYVVEDQVQGPQTNAPSGYIHNNILRSFIGGINGVSGIIPNSPIVNTNYTHSVDVTIPAVWKLANLRVIGAVYKVSSNKKYTLNSSRSSIITEVADVESSSIEISPNPTKDFIKISNLNLDSETSILIVNLDGQISFKKNYSNQQGDVLINIKENNLPSGVYFINISSKSNNTIKKLVIE